MAAITHTTDSLHLNVLKLNQLVRFDVFFSSLFFSHCNRTNNNHCKCESRNCEHQDNRDTNKIIWSVVPPIHNSIYGFSIFAHSSPNWIHLICNFIRKKNHSHPLTTQYNTGHTPRVLHLLAIDEFYFITWSQEEEKRRSRREINGSCDNFVFFALALNFYVMNKPRIDGETNENREQQID